MTLSAVVLAVLVARSWGAEALQGSGRTLGAAVVSVAVALAVGDTVARGLSPRSLWSALGGGLLVGLVTLVAYLGVMMVADRKHMTALRKRGRDRRKGIRSMRVVVLLGRSTGGIGTHVADLTTDLRDLGDDVTVVTDPTTAERFDLPGARLWWPGRGSGFVGSVRGLRRLRRLVRDADVVHAHGHQAGLVAVLAAAGTGTPVVVSQHNAVLVGGPRRRVLDLVQRVVARRAALVTGASSDLVDEARRHGSRDARLAAVPSPRVPDLLAQDPLDGKATTRTGRRPVAGERDRGGSTRRPARAHHRPDRPAEGPRNAHRRRRRV